MRGGSTSEVEIGTACQEISVEEGLARWIISGNSAPASLSLSSVALQALQALVYARDVLH